VHADGTLHRHEHGHEGGHLHPHVDPARAKSITPWALFVIFVLGPCEPMIPLVMYPASKHSVLGLMIVILAFGAVTIATMLTVVSLALKGLERLPLESAERYSHALAGAALGLCGLGIVLLGL
jgi:sulfite exporter TauE/SafE